MARHTDDDDDRDDAPGAPRGRAFIEGESREGDSPVRAAGPSARLWLWLALLGVLLFGGAFAVVNYLIMPNAVNHGSEILVPDLTGAPLDSAQVVLQALGLRLTRAGESPDPTVPSGRIVRTDPPAGSYVKTDRLVSVVVSLGPELVTVPSIVGVDLQQARLQITNAGLAPGHIGYGYSEAIPAGMVIASSPPADSAVGPGATVDLRVSLGTPPSTDVMPDVRGRSVDGILELLSSQGYRVAVLGSDGSPMPEGALIVDQYPPPGSSLAPGDSILLVSKR